MSAAQHGSHRMEIVEAISARRLDEVRELAAEYADFLHAYWPEGDPREFAEEMTSLGEMYESILLALVDGEAAGCVMVRPSACLDGAAEVRRLYVRAAFRRLGVARALMRRVERDAVTRGHRTLVLVAVRDFPGGIPLYESLGYEHIEPYRTSRMPAEWVDFMAKRDLPGQAR